VLSFCRGSRLFVRRRLALATLCCPFPITITRFNRKWAKKFKFGSGSGFLVFSRNSVFFSESASYPHESVIAKWDKSFVSYDKVPGIVLH